MSPEVKELVLESINSELEPSAKEPIAYFLGYHEAIDHVCELICNFKAVDAYKKYGHIPNGQYKRIKQEAEL